MDELNPQKKLIINNKYFVQQKKHNNTEQNSKTRKILNRECLHKKKLLGEKNINESSEYHHMTISNFFILRQQTITITTTKRLTLID